jgi:bifunctional NMN adenylyltransferase/nudix hydrolase
MTKYDTIVYMGRFQPIHNVHAEIIERACSLAKELIIIVGSADQPRTFKNPWTSAERVLMIQNVLNEIDTKKCRVAIRTNIDTKYNDTAWVERTQKIVAETRALNGSIAVIGHKKDDATTEYMDMFPQWQLEDVGFLKEMHATDIREAYFAEKDASIPAFMVPPSTARWLQGWKKTAPYTQIVEEHKHILDYKKQFAVLPYPVVFVTVDAALIQSGHILMIRRRAAPGKGLWALPGGFLNAYTDKSIDSAMIRELREETGIKIPAPALVGSIRATRVFDGIERSERGRVITHAFAMLFPDGPLPRVKGMDDADKARWVPLSEVKSSECFDDHYEIIQWAKNVTRKDV